MATPERFSILLVDDDPMVIRVLNGMLSDFAPIRFATSGAAALKLARAEAPDLVLLDVEMPEFSGFEVCKAFKADSALRDVPIIFITGHESTQLETAGLQMGAADFISKPPNASLVLARVRTYQRLKTLSDTMRSAVTTDFLTVALTRRQLEKALTQEWLRCLRSHEPLALLVVDIDEFTTYNAECGEEQGDHCLRALAEALREIARRPGDLVGRWHGGQLALLLPGTPARGARALAQRVIDAVDALPLDRRVTVSVGGGCLDAALPVAMKTLRPRDTAASSATEPLPESLVAAADRALASARAAGGHQARFVDLSGPGARLAVSA